MILNLFPIYNINITTESDEDKDNKCKCNPTFIKIMKYMIAIVFFLCAAAQTALDYYQYSKLMKGIEAGSWKSYQCAVFVFTNSPNALHAVAAFFAFSSAVIIHKFDKSARVAIMIFLGGEILVGIIVTPFFASIITHLIAGLFTYGWIAIFIFAMSFFILYKVCIFIVYQHSLCKDRKLHTINISIP